MNKNRSPFFLGLLLTLSLGLGACQSQPTLEPTITPTPDILQTDIYQTLSALISAIPPTQLPTETFTPTPTASPTEIPQEPSASPTATIAPDTLLAAYAGLTGIGCLPQNTQQDLAVVLNVIDGDTIQVIINGQVQTVAYLGIDTPPLGSGNEATEVLAQAALQQNKTLVEGKIILLVKDTTEADASGNLLRYVLTEDQFVNLNLVSQGFAFALAVLPDIACQVTFEAGQPTATEIVPTATGQPTLETPATSTPIPVNSPTQTLTQAAYP
jgi:endonuclease YncB( thermonuclease family)